MGVTDSARSHSYQLVSKVSLGSERNLSVQLSRRIGANDITTISCTVTIINDIEVSALSLVTVQPIVTQSGWRDRHPNNQRTQSSASETNRASLNNTQLVRGLHMIPY